MANSNVTNAMRAVGWNVRFTIGSDDYPVHFAGLYQAPDTGFITFADVCRELALCFDLPATECVRDDAPSHSDSQSTEIPWENVAFFHTPQTSAVTAHVVRDKQNARVPCLTPTNSQQQRVLTYHIVRHDETCSLLSDPTASLADHIREKCAVHLRKPSRRHHPSYLPPYKASLDPRVTTMPLRGRRKTASSSKSPTKRSASRSTSPGKSDIEGAVIDDPFNAIVGPRGIRGGTDELRRIVDEFRLACLAQGTSCAVSGEGESWHTATPVGPGVQACHIVPQNHYHLYPVTGRSTSGGDGRLGEDASRLVEAWLATWSPSNGILLMKHMHEFFDSRLFSIHPETLRIRAFVPYGPVMSINGTVANVPETVDRHALKHHYDMCCIENMAARQPAIDFHSICGAGLDEYEVLRRRLDAVTSYDDDEHGCRGQKRRRLSDQAIQPCTPESYITLENSRELLADVDDELVKWIA